MQLPCLCRLRGLICQSWQMPQQLQLKTGGAVLGTGAGRQSAAVRGGCCISHMHGSKAIWKKGNGNCVLQQYMANLEISRHASQPRQYRMQNVPKPCNRTAW